MEQLQEKITQFNDTVIWGPPMLILFLAIGIYMTVMTNFFQITQFGHMLKHTIIAAFTDRKIVRTDDKKAISQFQAFATALASSVGTGNIVGVATAIASGGPGAVFWMWIAAFFGMMTSYSENVLGIYFRYRNTQREWVGGPMVYIEKGLRMKWLAVAFSVFCFFASFGIGSIAQVNSISTSMQYSFSIPPFITGIILMILTGNIILGGLKRIVLVTEKLVPLMSAFYLIGTSTIIFMNVSALPAAFHSIFTCAFNFRSAGSGIMGYTIARAIHYGVARGVFSNEAGLGSSVMVHCSSDTREPAIQGMWGMFQVFFDTIIVCTMTALSILTTGAHTMEGLKGAEITLYAFSSTLGRAGGYFITLGILLFAYSTILGWSVYGSRAAEYLGGIRLAGYHKVIFLCSILVGALSNVNLVFELSDMFNGLMALPNLIAILSLSGIVLSVTRNYRDRTFLNSEDRPMISFYH